MLYCATSFSTMRRRFPLSAAFTLIELLVVISIIAILAGLLFPVLGRVQDNARSTKCTSNLRQIGGAINAYAADNDNALPGPLATWQFPMPPGGGESATDKQQLCRLLAKYVGLSERATLATPTSGTSIFVCPSNERENRTLLGPVYVLNPRPITALNKPPFGKADGDLPPVSKAVLSNWEDDETQQQGRQVDLTRTWAIKDADQLAFVGSRYQGEAAPGNTPAKPVHGDHRNALFYDFHVGKLSAEMATNDQIK